MTMPVLKLASSDTSLSVEFWWSGDRFAHRLVDGHSGVMVSIEGEPTECWPTSAPIQQLSLESLHVGNALMGVGSAGVSHYSVSVHWEDSNQSSLIFDFACRCKTKPAFLGSTYRANERFHIEPMAGSIIAGSEDEIQVVPNSLADSGTLRWSYRVGTR